MSALIRCKTLRVERPAVGRIMLYKQVEKIEEIRGIRFVLQDDRRFGRIEGGSLRSRGRSRSLVAGEVIWPGGGESIEGGDQK
jgi:hypothetical protein